MTRRETPRTSDRAVENQRLSAALVEPPASVPDRAELVELAVAAVEDPSVMFDVLDGLDQPQMRALVIALSQALALVAMMPAGVDPAWFVARVQLASATPIDPAGGVA